MSNDAQGTPKVEFAAPWPAKVLVFNSQANSFEPQPTPVAEKCACGAQMVQDCQNVVFCPVCKRKEGV